jgi:hypothetical protein
MLVQIVAARYLIFCPADERQLRCSSVKYTRVGKEGVQAGGGGGIRLKPDDQVQLLLLISPGCPGRDQRPCPGSEETC